ncbi:MAG: porin family protein [Acidimicrobiia bacterium]|nr:porin family protein [Acidimicrobiia bacterium]
MRHSMARTVVVLATCSVWLTAGAQSSEAEVLLTPYAGLTFGGDTEERQNTFGASLASTAGGVLGFEVDLARTGNVFRSDSGDEGALTTVMANLQLGAPIGPVRPYVSGGIGLMRSSVDGAGGILSFTDNTLGVNVGGGLMGFFTEHVGARADIRFLRSLSDGVSINPLDFDPGAFDIWRGTAGLVFRF